ncbi:MAG: 50S ribosomal protein L16 [Candidatus Woesearchaeota archaeon]
MAKLRKFCAYRRLERPYSRISKFREKSFIRITPNSRIVKYNSGENNKVFPFTVSLVSKRNLNIRDNALESARQTSNRYLEKKIGLVGFSFSLRPYPHQILRENPLAAGAGADRMSTGMSHSFGKPIGIAARVKEGQIIMTVDTEKNNIQHAKNALKRAASKLPCSCSILVSEK